MQTINTANTNEARKQIDSLSKDNEKVVVISQLDDEFNRKILENKKVDMFVLNEDLKIKDYMKQRNSQLNEILCKLAVKNNIIIGVEIEKIVKKSDIEKAKSLARLRQNIMLCKKSKCNLICYAKNLDKNKKELQSLILTLGGSTKQAKDFFQESF